METRRTRKQIRLEGYDYSQKGAYFVTVCVQSHVNLFWKVPVGASNASECVLTYQGRIVEEEIRRLNDVYPGISVDKYVIMPNHIHLILMIDYVEHQEEQRFYRPTVSRIIQQTKGIITKRVGHPLWQKSFHDHIIRNDEDYSRIWEYIDTNPLKWQNDCYYVPFKPR